MIAKQSEGKLKKNPGCRVGAVRNANAETVFLFGFGVYDGDFEPPFGPMGMTKEEYQAEIEEWRREGNLPGDFRPWQNPRITLDSGEVVWGAQCWWGTEAGVLEMIGGRRVEVVPVPGKGAASVE